MVHRHVKVKMKIWNLIDKYEKKDTYLQKKEKNY